MKVLYFITSEKGTPGGHFFSLEHLCLSLCHRCDIIVVCIGKAPLVIKQLPFKLYEVNNRKRHEIQDIVETEKPDVIHCFDARSYMFLSVSIFNKSIKVVLTNAGGPPPTKNYPTCKDIIVFSLENLKFFQNQKRYQHLNLYYIPNRVSKMLIKNESKCKRSNSFLQIIRIKHHKHEQIVRFLNLLKKLVEMNYSPYFILAGTVSDESEKQFIVEYIQINNLSSFFELITDERVNKGSDLLCLADFIIATGRSVMEAASLGKVVLVPCKMSEIPIIMDKSSFSKLSEFNFSGRTDSTVSSNEIEKIVRLFSEENYRKELSTYTLEVSKNFFELTEVIVDKYINIYNQITPRKLYSDMICNPCLYIRFIYSYILH